MKLHVDHRTVFETRDGMLFRRVAEFERAEDAQGYVRAMELTGTPAAMAVPCPNVVFEPVDAGGEESGEVEGGCNGGLTA